MTIANLMDSECCGVNQNNGSTPDNIPLKDQEEADKKLVIMGARNPSENGRTVIPSLDSSSIKASKANEVVLNGIGQGNHQEPPDGGLRAWAIMIGSFLINGVLFSIINTYSLIYLELQKRLKDSGETEISSKAALVGSLTIGTTFFLSPVAGILTDKIGIQLTTFLGGALAVSGMYLSSLLVEKVEYLCLTYGVMLGLGASLAYTPSLVILGHYFKKHLGLVNGVVTTGSSVFTILLPYIMELMLRKFGLEGTFRGLAVLTITVMLCAILFKPIPLQSPDEDNSIIRKKSLCNMLRETVRVSIWKKKKYVVWAGAIPIALFGYFVPYVHIGKFVESSFPDSDKKLPVMCIGITSGVGRLIFGYIADLPKVNRILLQQISFISIGILTMLLSSTKSFPILLVIALCMGLFDGCFISLLGPIAFDICGQADAAQAIGFLLGMCSIPLTAGPPIAGLIYDHLGSYELPFLLAGIPPIVGALAMFLVYRVSDEPAARGDDELGMAEESLTDTKRQNGMSCVLALLTSLSPERMRLLDRDHKEFYRNNSKSVCSLDRLDHYHYSDCYVRRSSNEDSPLLRNYESSKMPTTRTLQTPDDLIVIL